MKSKSIGLLLESTVLSMLAAAAGCGGEATTGSAPSDAAPPLDAAVHPDAAAQLDSGAYVDARPLEDGSADPCPAPARGYSLTVCGDQGDRLTDPYVCTVVYRQTPCSLLVDTAACGIVSIDQTQCAALCGLGDGGPSYPIYCNVQVYSGNRSELSCGLECPGGRRPEGYGGEPSRAMHPLGRFFARLAQLETVSIGAFGALADELARHGAAADLIERARRARRDEVRHARTAWGLARRYGATPQRLARMPRARQRSIAELAEENAAEGCVRETFGAMVTAFQARTAHDGAIAEAMRAIAADEAEHAKLAWDLDAFFTPQLDEAGRATRARALRGAVAELRSEIGGGDAGAAAGMPSREVALLALAALEHSLG